jgi:hydrogenase large subunit
MPPFDWLSDQQRYTWDKAPRYDGRAVQVGPVARVLLAYAQDEPSVVALLGICMGRPEIRLE